MTDLLSKWFSPNYLRSLLLDPDKSNQTCIQIARFLAAYYLDFLLYLPSDSTSFHSLYLWGNLQKEDLSQSDILLDRVKVSAVLPVEFSPALPALLLVKYDCLIEAINYADHFDDRRTSITLRLLADSLHGKDLTTEYIKSMVVDNVALQIEKCTKPGSFVKFTQDFTESVLQLDVALQNDFVIFLEQFLISSAELAYSELPLEAEEMLPNPVFEHPGKTDTGETKCFSQIFGYIQILLTSFAKSNRIVDQLSFIVKLISTDTTIPSVSPNYSLHRVLLLMLRITHRQLFSVALRKNDKNTSKIAERYQQLLGQEHPEHVLLRQWFIEADEDESQEVQKFLDMIQANFQQISALPPLHSNTRELWLRRIVLNSTTNHRDVRQEKTMDWFRSVCHPKHRVGDMTMSQMLFINSQWTSPGFTFIQPSCLAIRLSIHPNDICFGTLSSALKFSESARDLICTPRTEFTHCKETTNEKIFTERTQKYTNLDLLAKYGQEIQCKLIQSSPRFLNPLEEQMRLFSMQQGELQRELEEEIHFLNGFEDSRHSRQTSHTSQQTMQFDMDPAKQLNIINQKLDAVLNDLSSKKNASMYIREEDEESEISELPLLYEEANIPDETPIVEKLDFGILSSRTPVSNSNYSNVENLNGKVDIKNYSNLSTAKSFTNPSFSKSTSIPQMSTHWMQLIPLPIKKISADNLLIYREKEEISRVQIPSQLSLRDIDNDHKKQERNSMYKNKETQMSDRTFNNNNNNYVGKKIVDKNSVTILNKDDIRNVLEKVGDV
uniref:Uncharacterized protein n=1 Tax=Caenorhabditis japonica TaxID=281687 RepID=A0A8R1I5Z8_CAEJA